VYIHFIQNLELDLYKNYIIVISMNTTFLMQLPGKTSWNWFKRNFLQMSVTLPRTVRVLSSLSLTSKQMIYMHIHQKSLT